MEYKYLELKLKENVESRIKRIISLQQAAVKNEENNSTEIRKDRLERTIQLIRSNKAKIIKALQDDFGIKDKGEALLCEILATVNTLEYSKKNLKKWMRRSPRKSLQPLGFLGARTFVNYQPLGSIGVIVPWNFPFNLCFGPLGSIFAGGNRVIVKPSEIAPASGDLIQELITTNFNENEATVITGDVAIAEIFCRQPFDHILFTGSSKNAVKVMKGASENLVPVTLELGGKSPAIISESANLKKTASRILAGKILNAGQICLAPDYVLIQKHLESKFVSELISAAHNLLPNHQLTKITAVINESNMKRINNIIRDAEQKGGRIIKLIETEKLSDKQIAPTIILNTSKDMLAMNEEIFGPILPILNFDHLAEAISFINDRPNPLGLYWFGEDKHEENIIINHTKSGGITINDVIAHVAQDDAPFGGVGSSGLGSYHGKEGFLNFSHVKTVHKQTGLEWPLKFIRPPYSESFFKLTNYVTNSKK